MTTAENIAQRYAKGYVTEKQLDGTGAAEGSTDQTRNYVALRIITQEQADAIKAGLSIGVTTEMAQALQVLGVDVNE